MSLPAFLTLKNKNELNLMAQMEDKKNGVSFKVKGSSLIIFWVAKNKITKKVIPPVISK